MKERLQRNHKTICQAGSALNRMIIRRRLSPSELTDIVNSLRSSADDLQALISEAAGED